MRSSYLILAILLLQCSGPKTLMVAVKPGAIIRAAPSLDSPVVAQIPFGTMVSVEGESQDEVEILGVSGHWLRVSFQEKSGWVFSGLLSVDQPEGYLLVNKGRLYTVDKNAAEWIQDLLLRSNWSTSMVSCSESLREEHYLANCVGEIQISDYGSHSQFVLSVFPRSGESHSIYAGNPAHWEIRGQSLILHGSKSTTGNNYNFELEDCYEISSTCPRASISISGIETKDGKPYAVIDSYMTDETAKCQYSCFGSKGARPIKEEELNP